jgi:hypothetical protein
VAVAHHGLVGGGQGRSGGGQVAGGEGVWPGAVGVAIDCAVDVCAVEGVARAMPGAGGARGR